MSQRKEDWRTLGGIEVPKIVGPDTSGKPPYTRGIHDSMYRSRLWTMRPVSYTHLTLPTKA